jgi:hypothetical protein
MRQQPSWTGERLEVYMNMSDGVQMGLTLYAAVLELRVVCGEHWQPKSKDCTATEPSISPDAHGNAMIALQKKQN